MVAQLFAPSRTILFLRDTNCHEMWEDELRYRCHSNFEVQRELAISILDAILLCSYEMICVTCGHYY